MKNANGALFGLSNNHVTGGCNYTEVGSPILAPGPVDAGPNTIDPFTIGRHFECAPMLDGLPENLDAAQNADAALFAVIDAAKVSSLQRGAYDTPSAIGPLVTGINVMKAGRTTGITKGKVVAKAADFDAVDYEIPEINLRKTVYFKDIFSIEASGNQPFADLGDSGSLIIEVDGQDCPRSVGIVVGVASDLSYTLALPIKSVLDFFKVNLVHGHNL